MSHWFCTDFWKLVFYITINRAGCQFLDFNVISAARSHPRTIKGPLGEGLGVQNTINCNSWAASCLLQPCKYFSLGKIPTCSEQPDSHLRTIKGPLGEGLGVQNTNCYSWAASYLLQLCKYFSLGKSHLRTMKGPQDEGLGVQNTNCYSWAASYLLQLCKDFSLGKIPICSYQPDMSPEVS